MRDGTVVDKISTTIKRLCDWKLGEYKGEASGSNGAWGVGGAFSGLYDVFRGTMQIGDCVLLQVEPKSPDIIADAQATTTTTSATSSSSHPRLVDLELVKKQIKVTALQKVDEGKYRSVTFPPIMDIKKIIAGFQVGDKPWEKNPEIDTSSFDENDKIFRDGHRRQILSKPEDLLDSKIEELQKVLDTLVAVRDIPGKREEVLDEERKRVEWVSQWDERSVAIGGAWIKATTRPPDGRSKLQVLKVRNGGIVDCVSTTIAQYCRFCYDQKTMEYKGEHFRRGPGWGVRIHMMTAEDIFEQQLEVGDAIVLSVDPIEYNGELIC